MNYPFELIESILHSFGWQINKKENFMASDYWWTWEQWEISYHQQIHYLNFLIDPQDKKELKNIWAISICSKEPTDREEAENEGKVFAFNKTLKANLTTYLKANK